MPHVERSLDGTLLIIGIGNSLRRDDGAGLLLAEALAAAWRRAGHPVHVLTTQQLAPEHALEVADAAVMRVLFVDAAVGISTPRLDAVAAGSESFPAGGHTLGAATILLYAQTLAATLPPAWLLTLPAYDLAHGEGLSPSAQAHLDELLRNADALWARLLSAPPL